jgi:uncharacterized cupin superfamily protein
MSQHKIIRLTPDPIGFGDTPDELDAEMFASGSPVQHSHSDYEDDELGLYIGVWDTNDMHEAPGPYACDEFMWVLEGEVEIKNGLTGTKDKVTAGQAFVIPRGYNCQWLQTGYLRKYYVISENPNEEVPEVPTFEGIIKPHVGTAQTPVVDNGFYNLVNAKEIQKNDVSYTNVSGKFYAGTWDSEAFESSPVEFPVNKFAYVLEGILTLTDQDGQHDFVKGDAFFIPAGTICSAKSNGYVRTNYSVLEK